MKLFMVMVCVVFFALLVIVAAVRPHRSKRTHFELVRRSNNGDDSVRQELRREKLLQDVVSLQSALQAVLLTSFVLVSIATFGWTLGVLITIFVALYYQVIAQSSLLQRQASSLYDHYEPQLLATITQRARLIRLLRSAEPWRPHKVVISSREELEVLIREQNGILSPAETKLLLSGMDFGLRLVRDVMTPRSMIDSIGKTELLGPLVLDDLHKTGHSRFPVVDGDVDTVLGTLHVQDMLSLDRKQSVTAEKAMEPRVFYIREDRTLTHALAAFLRTHHHLFIVVNEFRETVGLLSLEDVIEALLGQKIIDEFDTHEDLRIVASRNAHHEAAAEHFHDV